MDFLIRIWIVKWFRPILLGGIAAVELGVIFSHWPTIWRFLEANPDLRLLSTIIPILLSAPFAYFIWSWRDHDKQRIMNYDESRLALDTRKNIQETERWEYDLERLKFEGRKQQLESDEFKNDDIEIELKTKINELSIELNRLKSEGMIVPKIDEKFIVTEDDINDLKLKKANKIDFNMAKKHLKEIDKINSYYQGDEVFQRQNEILKNLEDINTRYNDDQAYQKRNEILKNLENIGTRYENEEEYQKQNKILKNLEDIGTRYDNDELKQLQKEHLKDLEKLQHKYEKIKTSY